MLLSSPSQQPKYSLNPQQYSLLTQRTDEIRQLVRSTVQNIIDIGNKLHEIKSLLGHGMFGRWLKSEFNWSVATATRMMQVSQQFKNVNLTNLNFSASALYLLAAPSTPQAARDEAIHLGQKQLISYCLAKKIVNKHKRQLQSFDYPVISDFLFSLLPDPNPNRQIIEQLVQITPMVSSAVFEQFLLREALIMRRTQQFLSVVECRLIPLEYGNSTSWLDINCVKQLVKIIKQELKRPSDLATHCEKGRFLVLLPSTSPEGAELVAKSIKEQYVRLTSTTQLAQSIRLVISSGIPTVDISLPSFFHHLACSAKEVDSF